LVGDRPFFFWRAWGIWIGEKKNGPTFQKCCPHRCWGHSRERRVTPMPTYGYGYRVLDWISCAHADQRRLGSARCHVVHDSRQRAHGKKLAMLRTTWANTKDEIRQGLCGKPLTLPQLRPKYGSVTAMQCRVLQRHPITQGLNQARHPGGSPKFLADGSPALVKKIRLIDDSNQSQHNDILLCCSKPIVRVGLRT